MQLTPGRPAAFNAKSMRAQRERAGLTLWELRGLTGIPRAELQAYESGIRPPRPPRLAGALGYGLASLRVTAGLCKQDLVIEERQRDAAPGSTGKTTAAPQGAPRGSRDPHPVPGPACQPVPAQARQHAGTKARRAAIVLRAAAPPPPITPEESVSTVTTPRDGQLRVASCNLNYAGIAPGGDDSRWQASMTVLRGWDPDIVLLQEMATPAGTIAGLQAHLWRTANELGMTPLLGPPGPLSVTGNHPAILVATGRGLRILDAGPPPFTDPGSPAPSWCHAVLKVPAIPHPVAVYSVHLPARSAQEQLSQAQRIASLAVQQGMLTIAGGDWNSFPRDSAALRDLAQMDPHLRPPRMRTRPGPAGTMLLEPSYDVDDVLTGAGLTDAATSLPPDRRDPPA